MSVLSFVTSLFRPRTNRSDRTSNDSANCDSGSNHRLGIHRTLSKHALKTTTIQSTTQRKPRRFTRNYDEPNDLRQIFPDSKTNARPLMPKSNVSSGHAQQKGDASCDDRDGHYIVVPGREFTPRFKIRRLLGQGTFGKVMECADNTTGRLVAIKVIRAVPKYRDAAKIEIRVLQTLQRNDPTNSYQCMHVNETFDHRNHVCMVFDLLGPSVFDFLKENEFRPFSLHHVQLFAEQLLRSVAFLHSLNLVHTDLKPENILLESGEYDVVPFGSSTTIKTRMLRTTNIRLIDFGSATFNNEYHSQVVSTRHYRAPEIILNLGWSFACDMWSVGCIILELLTGEALFQTHDNNEHLAMMDVVIGRAPAHIVRATAPDLRAKFFRADGTARYPTPEQPRQSSRGLRAMRPLAQLVNPATNPIYANLHDLLFRLLQYDPRARISAKDACEHPFFRYRVGPDGRLATRPMPPTQEPVPADLVPSPVSASQRSFRPSYPASNAALAAYAYSNTSARAPLRVSDYALSASHSAPKPAAAGPYYREPNAAPHSPYKQDFSARPASHYYQVQPYGWQHPGAAHSGSIPGYETKPAVQPQVQLQAAPAQRSSGKRKSGVPVDSGYFADLPSTNATGYSSGKRKNGVPIDSGFFPDVPSANDSSQSSPGGPAMAQPHPHGYFPPGAPYGSVPHSAKGCNLPPITHAYQAQAPNAHMVSGVGVTQQPYGYHQQRHSLFGASAVQSAMPPMRLLPLDANTTPTLTMATTATPTPNSSSQLGGSHSMENVVPSVAKPSGRSLPSLAMGAAHMSTVSGEFARASLKEYGGYEHRLHKLQPPSASPMSQQVPGRNCFYQLPPAQTLLQAQSHSGSLDYNHAQFAPPSSANNSSY
ncbi:serine threonine protein kinase CMGC group [Coemansia sp. RSA 720]|nr:serine threonine protein kinase CMGC group [Coemansia sp. RSA 720]